MRKLFVCLLAIFSMCGVAVAGVVGDEQATVTIPDDWGQYDLKAVITEARASNQPASLIRELESTILAVYSANKTQNMTMFLQKLPDGYSTESYAEAAKAQFKKKAPETKVLESESNYWIFEKQAGVPQMQVYYVKNNFGYVMTFTATENFDKAMYLKIAQSLNVK